MTSSISAAKNPLKLSIDPGKTKESNLRKDVISSPGTSPDSASGSPCSREKQVRGRKSPREMEMNSVHEELEKLNIATDVINKLELQLDEARSAFAEIRSSWSQQLEKLSKKLGSCIDKSRPYYEAKLQARQTQDEAQKAALRFERANSMHAVAKQQVSLTQESLDRQDPKVVDPACLEVLNHHIQRVNEAERERIQSEDEHRRISQMVEKTSGRVIFLEKDLSRQIKKSKVYFDRRVEFTRVLEEQKALIERIEMEVKQKKRDYTTSLRNLEKISEKIHERRRLGERGAGVGSESPPPPVSESAPQKENLTVETGTVPTISPLSSRAQCAINQLKSSPKSPKVSELIASISPNSSASALNSQDSRSQRALSEPPEHTMQFLKAIETVEKSKECAPTSDRDQSSLPRRPASFAGVNHTGILLLAHQLSEYDWFTKHEMDRNRAFSFPPEELDLQYRTAPEGVKPFPTPPRTPVDLVGSLTTSMSVGALDRLAAASSMASAISNSAKQPLEAIISVSPPSTPAAAGATQSASAREPLTAQSSIGDANLAAPSMKSGHRRNISNWSNGTFGEVSSIGDSLSLSGFSDASSLASYGNSIDDETKLNRMLRSHTSLIQEIEEVADRAKFESQRMSGGDTSADETSEKQMTFFPSYDRGSASGESCG